MKLELGVGDHPNLYGEDVFYADVRDCGIRPLVVCDVFAPLPFSSGQFTQVSAHHVLEHCSHQATDATLKEWVRCLAPRGLLHIEIPDLRWQALMLLWNPIGQDVVRLVFGDQTFANDTNVHRSGFTRDLLSAALTKAGCSTVRVEEKGGCLVADGWVF